MVCCVVAEPAGGGIPPGVLESIARACSPRVAPYGDDAVVFDVEGLSRVFGPPAVMAAEVDRLALAHGIAVRVALAETMTAAWILAHARPGLTLACGTRHDARDGTAGPGATSGVTGREALALLPTSWLATVCQLDGRAPAGDDLVPAPGGRPDRSTRPRHFRQAPSPRAAGRPPDRSTMAVRPSPERSASAQVESVRALYLDRLRTFERWGIRTCGEVAALARADLHARMGPVGVRLHQAACGEDLAPLVPAEPVVAYTDRVELEWPIADLEPLTFVLARMCERLSSMLERADRGAVAIQTTLVLVTRESYVRRLVVPAPLRDARVLRTLIALDLESHPPPAGIDVIDIQLDVTPGRILQGSLLTWAVPTPEDLSTLLARLGALVGGSRVGAPVDVDSHDRRQVALVPFRVLDRDEAATPEADHLAGSFPLRRFRLPIAARVTVDHGMPVAVWPSGRVLAGGRVVMAAGPWRSSGSWWTEDKSSWDRDEWDVELPGGLVYRLARVRTSGCWEVEGVFD